MRIIKKMNTKSTNIPQSSKTQKSSNNTAFAVLLALGLSHLFNDTLQSVITAVYPLLKDSLLLSFSQIGMITLVFQLSSSVFQPLIGLYTDKKPQPYSLPIGMCFTMAGIFLLSLAGSFEAVLVAVMFTGMGSAIFHPEASRLAYMAAGGRPGTAQSLFQVGGNIGSSLGPLLAAVFISPYGQGNIKWLCGISIVAIMLMLRISIWYKNNLHRLKPKSEIIKEKKDIGLSAGRIKFILTILLILIFSKYFYMASITSYYTFFLIDKFGVSTQDSQMYLFAFLFAVACGTLIGGPVGDKIGRKYVIWISILGAAPFALMMPYANLFWTCVLSIIIGFILASAFSAILVYAQELLPGKVGLVAGLFFGLAFGIAGIGSALMGKLADMTSIAYVYQVCAFLPLIGVCAAFLPNFKKVHK
ncbi:fosmidomycin resistance protein [Bacteroidales bacterium]|nr:fosmidomycin resistance protein [Bacteroidales bacterium]